MGDGHSVRITFATLVAHLSKGVRSIHTYAKALKERGYSVCVATRDTALKKAAVPGRVKKTRALPPIRPRLTVAPFHPPRAEAALRPIDASEAPDADVVIATWWESRVGREISAVHPEQSYTLKRNGDAQ
jgi:hypothetical protein